METQSINEKNIIPLEVSSPENLYVMLESYGIPVEEWEFANLFRLLMEVKSNDTRFILEENELKRLTEVAVVDIYSEDGKMHLFEDRQENYNHKDELVDTVVRDFSTSISETKKPHETFIEAALRGAGEELGIFELDNMVKVDEITFEKRKEIYPGLKCKYNLEQYAATMPQRYFNPEGYMNYEPNVGYTKIVLQWEDS